MSFFIYTYEMLAADRNQLSPSAGIEILKRLGMQVSPQGPNELSLAGTTWRLRTQQRTPSPAALRASRSQNSLHIMRRLTKGLREHAAANRAIGLVAIDTGEVWLSGEQLSAPSKIERRIHRTRAPWARFGILRLLGLTNKPLSQAEIASGLGITQAAVSQNLATLGPIVEKSKSGWRARGFHLIAKEFLDTYPGPLGLERYWTGAEPVHEQVSKVLSARPEARLSGDYAADLLAPWRMPSLIVFYAKSDLQLEDLGFIETDRERASLVEVIPADRTIWETAKLSKEPKVLDPLMVAYDMRRSRGVDTPEAVEQLLSKLR